MKRPRGRGRRNNNNNNNNNANPNKHFDSNGPNVRIRGSAKQVLDKYQQYASDALRSGDRIAAEGYLQHAEHYQRIVSEVDAAVAKQREERDARNAERDAKRRDDRGNDKSDKGDRENTSDAKSTDEADQKPEKAEKEVKPKPRRTYKKKSDEASADAEEDGVMKTISRGRKKKSDKDEAAQTAAE